MNPVFLALLGVVISTTRLLVHCAESSTKHVTTTTKTKAAKTTVVSILGAFPPGYTGLLPGNSSSVTKLSTTTKPATTTTLNSSPISTTTPFVTSSDSIGFASSNSNTPSTTASATSITESHQGDVRLEPGAIAGITIGSIVFAFLAFSGLCVWIRRRKSLNSPAASLQPPNLSEGYTSRTSHAFTGGYATNSPKGTPTSANFTPSLNPYAHSSISANSAYDYRFSGSTYNSVNHLLPSTSQSKTASMVSSMTGVIDPSNRESTTLPSQADRISAYYK